MWLVRNFRLVGILLSMLYLAASAVAQEFPTFEQRIPVATIDQERLFSGSVFGKKILAEQRVLAERLASENQRIESELEAEELSLTELRKTSDPADFALLAEEFDKKANDIRRKQVEKLSKLNKTLINARAYFFAQAEPVLQSLMQERGIVFILNSQAILLSQDAGDITDEAILRLNTSLVAVDP